MDCDSDLIMVFRKRGYGTICFSATVIAAIALAGCVSGPKLVKAGGTVKYKGAPLPGADIVMMSDASGAPSIARTDDEGRFTVTTGGKPGALVGTYKVAITAARNKRPVS